MKMNYVYGVLVVALIAGLIVVRNTSDKEQTPETTTVYDTFAQCIADSGAKFYGTYWCPHCKDQKDMFENSKKLPYVECSTADGQGQLRVCAELSITGYPTWTFADGTRLEGSQTFESLAEKTSCPIPVVE